MRPKVQFLLPKKAVKISWKAVKIPHEKWSLKSLESSKTDERNVENKAKNPILETHFYSLYPRSGKVLKVDLERNNL